MGFLVKVAAWFADSAHWQGTSGIPNRLLEHVLMSGAATLAAGLIALPLGVALGHFARGGNIAINISNIGRAIPSFAVLVLAFEVVGIGAPPAFIALMLLAIPPMVTNSYVGVREVDADVKDAARGMGMRARKILFAVELPLALPLIMAGVRTSAVQVVATATLAALVAWGGLGRYIIDGFAQQDYVQMFAGALLVAMLAVVTELALGALEFMLVPRALRSSKALPQVEPQPKAA